MADGGTWRNRAGQPTDDSELALLETEVLGQDPARLLSRGYSVTRINGRIVRDAAQVAIGAWMETSLHRGRVESIAQTVEGT